LRSEAFQATSSSVVDATFLQPIDPVDVCVSCNGGPNGNKCLVGHAAEKEELDIIELAKRIFFALFVEKP
jgi:hypothetical protein